LSETRREGGRSAAFLFFVLLGCFFASGLAGLVYEVVWVRMLGLIFGQTVYAITTVLATFMAGLGLGARVMGPVADRSPRPIRLYGVLEIGLGLYGFFTPALIDATRSLYAPIYLAADGPAAVLAAQFGLAFAVLLPPTFLMGATLPVLSRALPTARGAGVSMAGLLYGLNTLGGVAGTSLAGYVLLPAWGMRQTIAFAACANLVIGALALLASRRAASATGLITEGGGARAGSCSDWRCRGRWRCCTRSSGAGCWRS
jgi:spermidine synthase